MTLGAAIGPGLFVAAMIGGCVAGAIDVARRNRGLPAEQRHGFTFVGVLLVVAVIASLQLALNSWHLFVGDALLLLLILTTLTWAYLSERRHRSR